MQQQAAHSSSPHSCRRAPHGVTRYVYGAITPSHTTPRNRSSQQALSPDRQKPSGLLPVQLVDCLHFMATSRARQRQVAIVDPLLDSLVTPRGARFHVPVCFQPCRRLSSVDFMSVSRKQFWFSFFFLDKLEAEAASRQILIGAAHLQS